VEGSEDEMGRLVGEGDAGGEERWQASRCRADLN